MPEAPDFYQLPLECVSMFIDITISKCLDIIWNAFRGSLFNLFYLKIHDNFFF